MVRRLAGEVVMIEAAETMLRGSEAACWSAGLAVARCLENRSGQDAMHLVTGTRAVLNRIRYPDHGPGPDKDGAERSYKRPERPERPD